MNYATFGEWVRDRVEDLVQFGVPRGEAEALMMSVELGGISAETKARGDDQFALDFRRLGARVMAERHGKTRQAMRKRWEKILKNKAPVVAAVVK